MNSPLENILLSNLRKIPQALGVSVANTPNGWERYAKIFLMILLFVLGGMSSVQAQTTLSAGDMAIIGMDTGAEEIMFVTFVALDAGTEIFFTDEEADNDFSIGTGEGTVLYTAPLGGITAGTVIVYPTSSGWSTTSDGTMTLGNSGDGVMAYQGTAVGTVTTFLHAIGKTSGDLGTFPGGFSNFMTFGADDGEYSGARTGDAVSLLTAINNSANWTTSGSGVVPFDSSSFTVGGAEDPTSFTATKDGVNSSTEIDLAWTDNAAGDAVLLAWNTSDTFGTPSGSYSISDPITGGGTVLQANTTESFTHSGLTAGGTYYYKIWSQVGTDYSTGITDNETLDCFANGPTGLIVNPTNQTDFTANWTAVPGALEYQLDVSTNATFSTAGTGSDDFIDGDFSVDPVWSGDTGSYTIQTAGTLPSGVASTDSSFLGSDASTGDIALVTPSTEVGEWKFSLGSADYDPSGANYFGVILMSDTALSGDISASSWNGYYLKLGENGSGDQIELIRRSGSSSTTVGAFNTDVFGTGALDDGLDLRITRNGSGEFEMFTATGFQYSSTPTTSEGTLTDNTHTSSSYFGVYQVFSSPDSSRRVYMDNIVLGPGSGGGDFVAAYSNRTVAGISQSVTGLTANTEYFFRVRAVGADSCVSDNSTHENVITLALPSPEIALLGTNGVEIIDGDISPAIADGTDFGAVDVTSGTQVHTFSITNSGAASLTLSGVITSGTHSADFEVTSAPAGTVVAGASTSLEITFDPSDCGLREATFTINNDDSNEGAYVFDVQGDGLISLGEALDNSTLTFTTSGDADWFGQCDEANVDGDAAQSGGIADDQVSILEITITGPGTVNFDWRVSSEEDFDFLHFIVGGVTNASISGDSGWVSTNFSISSGSHTVQWKYEKNGSGLDFLDSAWIDHVDFVPPADEAGPLFSNFGLNTAGNTTIDDATFTGSFDLLVDISDSTSGVKWTSSGPTYSITNPSGTQAVAPTAFNTSGHSDGESSGVATGAVTGLTFEEGTWVVNVIAEDMGGFAATNQFTYELIDDDSDSPTSSGLGSSFFSPIILSTLSPGDIAILGFNGDGAEDFSFLTFVDIAEAAVISFTDEGVTNGVLPGMSEGVVDWTAPVGGITAGTVIVISDPLGTPSADRGTAVETGAYNFSAAGDSLIAFQSDGISTTFLFAINTDSTDWANASVASQYSEVPPGLIDGVTALHMNKGSFAGNSANEDNGRYTNSLSGTVTELKSLIQEGASWEVTETDAYVLSSEDAILTDVVVTLSLTDADLFAGGWVVTGEFTDVDSGLDSSSMRLDITTPGGNQPAAFTSVNYTNSVSDGDTNVSLGWSISALASGDIELGSHTGEVVIADIDADRPDDALSITNFLEFQVIDDDETAPALASQGTSFNYVTFNGKSAGSEGTALTDADLAGGSITFSTRVYDVVSGFGSADFTLTDPTGTDALTDAAFDIQPPNGAIDSQFAPASNRLVKTGIDLTSQIELGIWTARVEVVDADADRTGDGATNETTYLMYVVDDDTQGPVTSNLMVNSQAATLFDTGFENIEGWVTHGGTNWTENQPEGDWVATDVFVVSFGGRGGAGSYAGMNDVGDLLQMPETDEAGYLSFFARLDSAPSASGSIVTIEKNDGGWTTVDTVTVDSTDFTHFVVPVLDTSSVVSLRFNLTTDDRSVHLDDIALTSYAPWTNATALNLSWDVADDTATGNSGLDDYEYTTLNDSAPEIPGDGTPTANTSVSLDITGQEGVLTGFVYAVDNDQDRGSADRAKGREVPYFQRIDQTAPSQIGSFTAVEGADPTTEIDFSWTHAADAGGTDLSPWQSYRIYYSDDGDDPTTADPYFDVANGNPNLGVRTTSSSTVSNFTYGNTYRVNVAGIDEAGNLGPLTASPAAISLSSFNITQGVAEVRSIATSGIHLSWTATRDGFDEVNRSYDLLYWDAAEFSEVSSNQWALIATVTNSFFQDAGQGSGINPTNLVDNMRFYRASLKDRWRTNQASRVASEEIYVLKNIHLFEGQNWVAFPGVPDEPKIEFVFGKYLPASSTIDQATKISWFERDGSPEPATTIFLQSSSTPSPGSTNWVYSLGGSGVADLETINLAEGVVVEIPEGAGGQDIQFIGQIPTNTISQTLPGNAYSLIGVNQPAYVHPSEMNLLEAGFTGGSVPLSSDRLWKFDRMTQSVREFIWYDTDDSTWKLATPGFPAVPDNYFAPDDAIVVHTRRTAASITHTNQILYSLPTKEMTP